MPLAYLMRSARLWESRLPRSFSSVTARGRLRLRLLLRGRREMGGNLGRERSKPLIETVGFSSQAGALLDQLFQCLLRGHCLMLPHGRWLRIGNSRV